MNSSSGPDDDRAEAPPRDLQRFATGSGPVNRRTARPSPAQLPVLRTHASLHQRLAQVELRQRLGMPLSQRLAVAGAASTEAGRRGSAGRPTPVSTASLVTAAVLTLCALGLFLAALQASWLLAGLAAAAAVATGGAWWAAQRRAAGRQSLADATGAVYFDSAAVAKLDEVLNQLASELTESQLAPLRQLADTLERIAPLMRRVGVSERFTQEDQFYVTECVRRYLPDTLQAYLQVPRERRAQSLPADPAGGASSSSADALLAAQLLLLQGELARREAALASSSTEALQKQSRFLKARRSPD